VKRVPETVDRLTSAEPLGQSASQIGRAAKLVEQRSHA
jgi:hypothetical protein